MLIIGWNPLISLTLLILILLSVRHLLGDDWLSLSSNRHLFTLCGSLIFDNKDPVMKGMLVSIEQNHQVGFTSFTRSLSAKLKRSIFFFCVQLSASISIRV